MTFIGSLVISCQASGYDQMTLVLQDGWSPLMVASNKGHLVVVKTLIEAGADVNQINEVGIYLHCFCSLISAHCIALVQQHKFVHVHVHDHGFYK